MFTDYEGQPVQLDGRLEEGTHVTVTQFKPMQSTLTMKKKRPLDAKVYLLWDKGLSKGGKVFKEDDIDGWRQVFMVPGWTGK